MPIEEMRSRFAPAVEEIINRCQVSDEFLDKEKFQVMVATIWGNAVLDPDRSGIDESDLPDLHDFLALKVSINDQRANQVAFDIDGRANSV